MRLWKVILVLAAACTLVRAQDPQTLGDAARHARQQKQQSQPSSQPTAGAANGAPHKASHVITNDEIPEQQGSIKPDSESPSASAIEPTSGTGKRPAEYWKSQILRAKTAIASGQSSIDKLQNSIHFAEGNYEKHVEWNERQRQKQRELEIMKSQLSQLQKRLEDMQETARRQGYGSSVYDP